MTDADGRAIGTPGDLFEKAAAAAVAAGNSASTTRLEPVVVPRAPLPVPIATKVRVGAYWYNDFGLESTFINANPGQLVWYSWYWNRVRSNGLNGQGYYPDRRPLLGWYQGDDPNVLSWQVKWLVEAGVGFVICQQRGAIGAASLPNSGGNWSTPSDINHWIFQLMTNVPAVAAGLLKTAFWVPGADDDASVFAPSRGNYNSGGAAFAAGDTTLHNYYDAQQYVALRANTNVPPHALGLDWAYRPLPAALTNFAAFLNAHKIKIETINRNGKTYPVAFIWSGEAARVQWGTGTVSTWLRALGSAVNAANPAWEGICVLVRQSNAPSNADGVAYGGVIDYDFLEAGRCLMLRTDYIGDETAYGAAGTYQAIVDKFPTYQTPSNQAAEKRRVLSCPTALQTVQPHNSGYAFAGHSPAKFQALLAKQVASAQAGTTWPMQLVYNVAEWAEAGPGLQPNTQDGFGYLAALKQVVAA